MIAELQPISKRLYIECDVRQVGLVLLVAGSSLSKKENWQEMSIKVKQDIGGFSKPYRQRDSVAVTIPKKIVQSLGLDSKIGKEFFGMVFVETDRGLLLVPFDKDQLNVATFGGALSFMNLSGLTEEDLDLLSEE